MDNAVLTQYAIILLAAISVGLIVFIVVFPHLSGEKKTEKRVQNVANRRSTRVGRNPAQDELNARRKNVQENLKELERKQKEKKSVSLRMRLIRAGLTITPKQFYLFSVIFAVVAGVGSWVGGLPPVILAAAIAFVSPVWARRAGSLTRMAKKRQNKFLSRIRQYDRRGRAWREIRSAAQ